MGGRGSKSPVKSHSRKGATGGSKNKWNMDELLRIAQGPLDNEAAHEARRKLLKKGIDWSTGKSTLPPTPKEKYMALKNAYDDLKKKLDVRNDPRGSGKYIMAAGIPVKGKAEARQLKDLYDKLVDADREYTLSLRKNRR